MTALFLLAAALSYITNAVKENLGKAFKNEAPSKYEKIYAKLHTGNPGTEGKSNVAGETTRKQVTLTGTSLLKNNAAIEWAAYSTTETIRFVSFWTAATEGTFLGYSVETVETKVTAGSTLKIAAEALEWPIS